jgi:hypothetical protein
MTKLRYYFFMSVLLLTNACSSDDQPTSTVDALDTELTEQDTADPAFTSKLEESLLQSNLMVSDAQDETHDAMISSDFDNNAEQHRVDFIDEVLTETSRETEQDAESLAEKFEELKSIEHAPITP